MTPTGTKEWPIRITGSRIVMREPLEKDRGDLIRLLTDPTTRHYLGGRVDHIPDSAWELSPLGLSWGTWVIARADDDSMLGWISLGDDRDELELSYALLPEYTGQGFAAEACTAVLAWARDELKAPLVIAVTQSSNQRSVLLLRKLGFTVRHGLHEFGAQQLLMERSLSEPLPSLNELNQAQRGGPSPPRAP